MPHLSEESFLVCQAIVLGDLTHGILEEKNEMNTPICSKVNTIFWYEILVVLLIRFNFGTAYPAVIGNLSQSWSNLTISTDPGMSLTWSYFYSDAYATAKDPTTLYEDMDNASDWIDVSATTEIFGADGAVESDASIASGISLFR